MNEKTLRAKEILAHNLKAYRIFFKMSQLEMAKHVHMSYRGYGKLERMEVAASLDTLDKLSAGLGISPAMLLCQDMIVCMPHKRQKDQTYLEVHADYSEEQMELPDCTDSSEEQTYAETFTDEDAESLVLEDAIDSREKPEKSEENIDDGEA